MITPQKVNRKQFFFLLYKFLLKNNIHREWYENSLEYKLKCVNSAYRPNYSRSDDFKTFLEKSINVYIDYMRRFDMSIGRFFYYIPASLDFYRVEKASQWEKITIKWYSKYCCTKYEE